MVQTLGAVVKSSSYQGPKVGEGSWLRHLFQIRHALLEVGAGWLGHIRVEQEVCQRGGSSLALDGCSLAAVKTVPDSLQISDRNMTCRYMRTWFTMANSLAVSPMSRNSSMRKASPCLGSAGCHAGWRERVPLTFPKYSLS